MPTNVLLCLIFAYINRFVFVDTPFASPLLIISSSVGVAPVTHITSTVSHSSTHGPSCGQKSQLNSAINIVKQFQRRSVQSIWCVYCCYQHDCIPYGPFADTQRARVHNRPSRQVAAYQRIRCSKHITLVDQVKRPVPVRLEVILLMSILSRCRRRWKASPRLACLATVEHREKYSANIFPEFHVRIAV